MFLIPIPHGLIRGQHQAFPKLANHLEAESPGLVLPVHGAGEEKGRGEPEAGAQGHEHHHQGPGQLDLINHVCQIEESEG